MGQNVETQTFTHNIRSFNPQYCNAAPKILQMTEQMEDKFRYKIHKMSATPLFVDDKIQAQRIIQNLMQVQDAIT